MATPPHPFGLHRSLDPPGALPQVARRLDATPRAFENEIAVSVEALSIDSTSFRQLRETEAATGESIRNQIARIVGKRGKMQNPVTGSGGMLLGAVAQIVPRHPAAHFDFVLGVPGAAAATAENLTHFARSIPPGCTWTVAGIGRRQTAIATMAIAMGGHVRVGFENHIFYRKGELADSNARFVERVVPIAREVGREPASIAEARQILHLPTAA